MSSRIFQAFRNGFTLWMGRLRQGCPTRSPRATLWPAMLSGVARVEIKAFTKIHGGKNFDAIAKLYRNYFGSYSIKTSILMICII